MLHLRCLLACLQLLSVCQVGLVSGYRQQRKLIEDIDWSYTGSLSQTNWVKKYPVCNGAKQSPINIDEGLTKLNMNLKTLTFQGWEQTSNHTLIRNTGKTVEINLTGEYYLSGGALDTTYRASRITFHWGKCNATSEGSEHSLEGQRFPLEMQILCFNDNQFETLDEAIKGNGKLKALSVLFKIGQENPNYDAIINGVDSVHRFGKKAELEPFVLLDLLPNYTDKYYTYNGSLTTPPCSETVEWIVFKDTVTIAEAQLEYFCEILTMQQSGYVMVMDYLQNNFRQQHYKLSGQVFSSYTGIEEILDPVCSSEPDDVQAESQNSTSLLIYWKRPRVVYEAVIERYVVYYQQLQGEDQTRHEYLTDGYQDLGAILYNLMPNTSYVLQVVALCNNGLYGKRSDQVVLDLTMDSPGNDPFIDVTETEEDIEDSEEDENENRFAIPLSTESTRNQIHGQGAQATTSQYTEELGSQPYKPTPETWKDQEPHRQPDRLKILLYPTLQSTLKPSVTDLDAYRVKTTEQDEEAQVYQSKELKSKVELWILNVSDSTKPPVENASNTNASNKLPVTTTSWKRRILMPTDRSRYSYNDTFTTTATFTSMVTPVKTTQGDNISLQSPQTSSSEDISPGTDKEFINLATDETLDVSNSTSQPNVLTEEMRRVVNTVILSENTSTSSSSSSARLLPSTSLLELEKPYTSTSTFPPQEAFQSVSPSLEQHGSASTATEVLSQTTQPVSNGEIPLQPSYTSEVFPLVNPLLSDTQFLKATPATPDIGQILHATPVFPNVDVSFEPSLSSYDGVPLLTLSSTSSSRKVFRHHAVSEICSQVTQTVATDTLSLHVSLALPETNALGQPSQTHYSDVKPHQTAHAVSEMLTHGHESDTFNNVQLISRLESSSTDLKMHALSTVSELAYPFSNNLASTEPFAISSDSSAYVHDSVGIFHQGTLTTMSSTELHLKPSTVMIQGDVLLQPTHTILSEGDQSEIFSGSGDFLNGIDDLKSLNESSASVVAPVKYTIPDLNHSQPIVVDDFDTGPQTTSTYGEVALHKAHQVMTNISSSNVIRETKFSPEINPVSLPTTSNFDVDVNAASENLLPVQPLNAVSTTSGDILLKATLAAASKTVSAFTDMLLLPTQDFFYEIPEKAINEALTQTVSQLPNTSIALAVPIVGELNEISTSYHIGSNTGSVLLPSVGATAGSLLHSTYVPPVGNSLSQSSVQPAYSQPTMSVLHENVVTPHLFSNVNSDGTVSQSDLNDITVKPLNIVPAYNSAISQTVSTPLLPSSVLQDTTLYIHTPPYAYPTHGIPVVSSRYTKGSVLPTSALERKAKESVHHPVILPNVYVSVTADSPNSESPSTLSMLTATSQTATDVLSTVSTYTNMGPSVVDDGYLVVARTDSTPPTEPQANAVAGTSSYVYSGMEKSNLSSIEATEQPEEGSALSTAAFNSPTSHDMEEASHSTPPGVDLKKHSDPAVMETHIQTENAALENTSESSSWAVLTGDEESGSGQSTSDSLSDNETSTDFNFADLNDRDKDFEVAVEPGKADLTPGSEMTSPPSLNIDRTTVVNENEAEASNSSHESRVGLAEGLESQEKTIIPLVVVSSLTFICLVVLVGILIYWRKCFQTAHFYLEDNTSPRVISAPPAPVFPVSDDVGAIPLKQFPKHVAGLHASSGFTQEFETLKEFYQEVQNCTVDSGITCDSSNHPDNKNKNRYINIVAYDHSRVKLSQMGEKDAKPTDYINANYVDGYNKPRAYIAAQGPLKSTAEDFWRMIWEHSVEVIVMITNLVEKGRRKCDQYWPSEGSEEYGTFLVTQKNTCVLAYFTVRTFTLRNIKIKKGSQKGRLNERLITQYHYTQWPDMGVPEYTLPVLTFVRKASTAKCTANGPVVVHCSAGVGRTGTYIVLDSMLQQIKQEGTVNIFGFLKHIRTQRNYLVQTEEQYIFIHDALAEAILSRETEVAESHIHAYVNALLTTGPSGKTRLETQFKLLSEPNILQCDYSTALKAHNRDKNRTSSVIPVERSRVGLSSLAREGTDYINASYITGYHESNEFIITQHPLLHTIKDFWRMIWDHNSQIIVMLPDNPNMAEDEFVYWPNRDEPITCETFTVSLAGEDNICLSNEERLIIQDFILEATQDDYVLEVKHFHCPKWPNPDSQMSKTFELINLIKEEAANKDGPIVVHDEYGGVTAGTFCALSNLMQQLEKENAVDVYQMAKMINLMRPGIFTDLEQFQFLYKAILSLVSTKQEGQVACMESNGSALPDGNTSESLESLV